MNKTRLALISIAAASLTAVAAVSSNSASVEMRFVGAADAYKAVEERLGRDAATAVRSVDPQRNSLSIDATHPQATKVREFLATFDRREEQVMVHAVISREVKATATAPARKEVLSRPTLIGTVGRSMSIQTSVGGESILVELEVSPVAVPE